MKTVITFGVFDVLHIGHILLFKHIKEQCGEDCRLVVAVQDSDMVAKYKKGTKVIYSNEERAFMVGAIKYVDEVIFYSSVNETIKAFPFDIFAKGPDQCHEGFVEAVNWCEQNGKEVITIPRTEGISASLLRKAFND